MKYKAEIFDKFQYLYDITGFNDHQLHSVIKFENMLDAAIMEKAVLILVNTVPILSRVYRNCDGESYWEEIDSSINAEFFKVVYDEEEFKEFTHSKTKEALGPQIKVCLLEGAKSSLSIVMNHMITDGAGFKECLYLLAEIYSKLLKNPEYMPDYKIEGDRDFKKIILSAGFTDRIKIFFLNNKDNNQRSIYEFPMSKGEKVNPFILTHEIPSDRFCEIKDYCKKHNTTLNDFILTAYFRVLSNMLNLYGKDLSIPIMIDMRRYLKDKSFNSLSNLSSTVIISIVVEEGEDFYKTLSKINIQMKAKKDNYLGLNTFLKLHWGSKIFGNKISYNILKNALENPKICMTNIGVIDSKRLIFEGSPVVNAFVCGSIKYRPHFQMAISSFADKLTLCVNLYGDTEDQSNLSEFLALMDKELNINLN